MLSWTSSHLFKSWSFNQPSCCPVRVMVGNKRTLRGAPVLLETHKVTACITCCIKSQPVTWQEYCSEVKSSLISEGRECWGSKTLHDVLTVISSVLSSAGIKSCVLQADEPKLLLTPAKLCPSALVFVPSITLPFPQLAFNLAALWERKISFYIDKHV